MHNDVTLVLGGAASGKSAWAEDFVKSRSMPMTYLATARAWDDEMKVKVTKHRERRGSAWSVIETPENAAEVLSTLPAGSAVLLDCATMWLTNLVLAEADLEAETDRLIDALAACPADVTVVSNEVGQGIVPDNALGRMFREEQGRLNIRLARQADRVVQVVAGLPNVLKGSI